MAAAKKGLAIGFPPPLLGDAPLRLPVTGDTDSWLALNKPAGVGVRAYPWDEGVPHLDGALNRQLQEGKPELVGLGADLFGSIFYLEPECSGVALFGKSREAIAELRNAYGSGEFEFRFLAVTPLLNSVEVGQVLEADAPLLPHDWKLKMIPSSAKGKKAHTRFSCLGVSSLGWALWEARANYLRTHQIRAHLAVLGMPVLGDPLYDGPDAPLLGNIMPKKRGPGMQAAVFSGLALHLSEVRIVGVGVDPVPPVVAEPCKPFSVMLKRLGLEGASN